MDLVKFLEALDTEMAQRMLADLQNDERRTPQLYNSEGLSDEDYTSH